VAFGLLGTRTSTKLGRDPIVILGFIVHIVAFFLVFLNLPNRANMGDTNEIGECSSYTLRVERDLIKRLVFLSPHTAYLDPPRASVALFCSFLLGFGDSCYNTQIYSLLGGVFAKKSTEAFSIFKFTQVKCPANMCKHSLFHCSSLSLSLFFYCQFSVCCCSVELRVLYFIGTESPIGHSRCVRDNWNDCILRSRAGGAKEDGCREGDD
jgi:hypothetical protein